MKIDAIEELAQRQPIESPKADSKTSERVQVRTRVRAGDAYLHMPRGTGK
jgi:hypothetical protein